ncbi:MAG TPA: deoxyguanosinetriphosphate triphosphohydrolase [Candidatus Angelobacter sp.]|nr:deoxyguanosinetriphosphate triphosphohydrolase [Candidatus Angelobacter sp.]
MLAPYAFRPEETRGRRYPEPRHPYRNDFQRDRDRIVHSRAFRRLENKTQVFTRRYSDHFRNRLTHTIEVSQISRTIACALELNEDFVETLALAHDVGHPPFGHSGEQILHAAMQEYGDIFDHNLHALYIVEEFEQRYADFPGLNLTFEVREGIVKHSCDYDAAKFPQLAEYSLDQRPPLEAQLIDLTDEIAYNTADLDDGLEARILTLEQIRAGVPVFARLFAGIERRYPNASEKLKFNETLKRVLDRMVSDLIATTRKRLSADAVYSVEAVRKHPQRLTGFSEEVEDERRQIKAFLYENLYYSSTLRAVKKRAEQVVAELFAFFMKMPEELPTTYQEKRQHEPLHHIVCAYIAGMTDNYIQDQHRRFCPDRKSQGAVDRAQGTSKTKASIIAP